MKKLIALILAMLMCLAGLSACTAVVEPGTETTTDAPETGTAAPETDAPETQAPTETDAPETQAPAETETTGTQAPETEPETTPATPDVEYDLEAAAEYVNSLYKKGETITAADYQVVGQVMIAGVKYMVTWTADNDKVKMVEGNPYWTVDVDEKAKEEHSYKLTATITAGDGTTTTVSFDRTVPEYVLWSFEEYINAPDGTTVVIEGIVVAMNSKSLGNTRNHLFLADVEGKGGYYCYQLDTDPVEAGVKVGMTVSVTAVTAPYSGMQETKGGTFTIVDETIKTVEPMDLTDKFAAGESLRDYVGYPVVIKGVTIGTQELATATSQYLFFELNGQKAYVRSYINDFPTSLQIVKGENGAVSSPDKDAMDADHAAHFGYTADATGILILYSGAPYLIPMSVTPFTNYEFVEMTAAEKVEAEKKEMTVTDFVTENTTLTLPLVGQFYEDVTIAWTVDNENFTIDADGKLVIALGDEQVVLTLTATITCGEETDTKTFKVSVKAISKGVYVGEHVDTPVVDTAYKFYLYNATLGKYLYFDGTINSKYLGTSENAADGVDVYLEAVLAEDGSTVTGYRFYFMNGEIKTYIDIISGGQAALVTENPTAVYNYVAETNIWAATVEGTEYYLGTYDNKGKTYTTISASKSSYINADNTGVTQFPAGFAVAVAATYVPNNEKAPVVDTAYKFYLYNATLGKYLYFDGTINSKYLGTSENAADGVDVYLEAVLAEDGSTVTGYRFYFMNGETKTYIDIISGGKAALVTENPTAVYNYVAETNIWAATVEGTEYYLGTYDNKGKTYTTISASKSSYINADNTGVTQFPAGFATLTAKKVEPSSQTAPVVDTAYKFYLYNVTLGKYLYFDGTINSKYLGTSTDPYDAVDVYVETVLAEDGSTVTGYRFYFMNGETKTYIDIISGGQAALVTENPTAVYNYVAETNIWAATVEGTEYYLGTYDNKGKTYTTISASKSSYINADNTGVTQFPAGFAVMVVAEDKPADPAPEEPETPKEPAKEMTIPEANAAADGTAVIVTGTVNEVNYAWSDSNGNMSVTIYDAEGNKLYIYKLATKVNKGDVITVTGDMDTYSGSRQIAAGATAEIISAHTCTEFTDATCTAPKTCTVCGATEGSALDHTYVDGTCTGCGAIEPSGEQTTLNVTIENYAAANSWEDKTLYASLNLNADITVTATSTAVGNFGANTGKYYINGQNWRIYQSETPAVTITAAEGKTIVSVKITYASQNTGVLTLDGANVESASVVTVNAATVTFSVGNTGTATNGQARITAIEVIYQ